MGTALTNETLPLLVRTDRDGLAASPSPLEAVLAAELLEALLVHRPVVRLGCVLIPRHCNSKNNHDDDDNNFCKRMPNPRNNTANPTRSKRNKSANYR